ncbi:MAG: hypothetical protein HXY28_00955 [Hydrogenophilaceae bacterium]|jgi:hypothetical protein|nr:hypothetical protein [Hydrogenophilaceae bacterium]
MTTVITQSAKRGASRGLGLALAVLSVILPALPFGPLFAQPPMPLAALWAAYGWAADDDGSWRRPALVAALGLLHDQMSGGQYGLFAALYLVAFLIGRFFARVTSSPNTLSILGGFALTAIATTAVAFALAPRAFGAGASAVKFAEAAAVTVLLFPFVRGLYMSAQPVTRAARRKPIGARQS